MTHYPATSVECVDTTGAGDAFVAGLLYGLASAGSAIPHHLPR
ncbi:aminoimidazole riboside kinase [Citrobacter koseri]|nr:aminoimidazole riboside kinase [Citrobacter koseri]